MERLGKLALCTWVLGVGVCHKNCTNQSISMENITEGEEAGGFMCRMGVIAFSVEVNSQ